MTMTDTTVEMTRDEVVAEIDRIAQKVLGLSATQLAVAYRARKLADPARVADAIGMLNLLPDSDPIFAAK